jgi:hypothetical protein
MNQADHKAILKIYESYERRKAMKRVNFSILFNGDNTRAKKWYQFWKI